MTGAATLDPTLRRLADCKHFLHVLKSSPSSVQKVILENADSSLLMCLCDIAVNVLNGNIRLDPESFARLRKYKTLIRSVAEKPPSSPSSSEHVQRGRGRKAGRAVAAAGPRNTSRAAGASRKTSGTAGHDDGPRRRRRRHLDEAVWCRQKRRIFIQKGRGAFLTTLLTSALGGLVGKVVGHYMSPQQQQQQQHDATSGTRGAGREQ